MSKACGTAALWRAVHSAINSALESFLAAWRRAPAAMPVKQVGDAPSIIQPLEGRVFFSAAPYIAGLEQVQEGVPYSLNLVANGRAVDHWSINWGDASDSQPGAELYSGSQTTATHTFTQAAQNVITATAFNKNGKALAVSTLGVDPTLAAGGVVKVGQSALANLSESLVVVEKVAVQPNGQFLVLTSNGLDRFNADGTIDTTFGTNGTASLPTLTGAAGKALSFTQLAIQDDGQIVIAGESKKAWVTAVYTSMGQLSSTQSELTTVAHPSDVVDVQFQDDEIVLLGTDKKGNNVLWLDNVASPSNSAQVVGQDANWNYLQAAINPSGGDFWISGDRGAKLFAAHYSAAGVELSVTKLKQDYDGADAAITVDSNGNALIGGEYLSRVLNSGSLDATFASAGSAALPVGFDGGIASVLELADGQILVAGKGDQTLARFNSDGSLDSTFGAAGVLATGLNLPTAGAVAEVSGVGYAIVGSDGANVNNEWIYPTANSLIVVPNPVPALTISGDSAADVGVNFSLDLAAQYPADDANPGTISSWTINWDDGSASSPDLQTLSGNPASVTHVFSQAGSAAITATAADANGSYSSNSLILRINATGPAITSFQVNGGSSDRTNVTSLTLNFNNPVTLPSGALTLIETDNVVGTAPPMSFILASSNGGATYSLTFASGSLPNGTFKLTVSAAGVTDGAGVALSADQTFSFYRFNSNPGGNVQFTDSLNLAGVNPTASINPIPAVVQNSPLTLTAAAAPYGNNGDALAYQWSLTDPNGQAFALPNSGVTSAGALTFTPPTVGTWIAALTVTDVTLSLTTTAGLTPFKVLLPLPAYAYSAPSSNPALPAGVNPFNPTFSLQTPNAGTPTIAAADNSAQPDQNLTITGVDFTTGTGAGAFADTQILAYGQTSSANATLSGATVRDATTNGLIATINPDEPANSMYLLWPVNSDGAGAPIAVNAPQVTWIGNQTAAPGATVSIYGQNLSNLAATPQSFVYLQPASGGSGQWAAVTSVNPYQVNFIVPAGLANGNYQVWLNNGLGGQYSWSQSPQNLTVAAAVTWPAQYEINIMNDHAVANGLVDDTAILQQAISAIHTEQVFTPSIDATIYFPAGTYLFNSAQIQLPSNIRLIGDGTGLTTLLFTGNLDTFYKQTDAGPFAIGAVDGSGKNIEIDSMSLVYNGSTTDGELLRERGGQNLTINGVRLIAGNGNTPIDWQSSGNVLLENSTVVGSSLSAISTHDMNINNTAFYLTNNTEAAITVWAGYDISITNCTVQDSNESSSTGWGQGRLLEDSDYWGSLYNEYVANNNTINLGSPTAGNDGEQINIEGSIDFAYGTPTSATGNTVTLPLSDELHGTPVVGDSVIVTAGDGVGQMLTVQSLATLSGSLLLTLNGSWKVAPDSTSHVEVGSTAYNSVFYDNNLSDQTGADGAANLQAAAGFEVWTGGYNLVFDGNTTSNLNSGVLLASASTNNRNPCFFIQITNNLFNNSQQYGIVLQPPAGSADPDFTGVVLRGNTINGVAATGFGGDGISVARGNNMGPEGLIDIETNTIESAPAGLALFTDPDTLVFDNTFIATTNADVTEISFPGASAVGILLGNVNEGYLH